jgi:hypothetical protein
VQVHSEYNAEMGRRGMPQRDHDSLKQKFKALRNTRKPTGDPFCPPHVVRAKQLQREIEARCSVEELDDERVLEIPAIKEEPNEDYSDLFLNLADHEYPQHEAHAVPMAAAAPPPATAPTRGSMSSAHVQMGSPVHAQMLAPANPSAFIGSARYYPSSSSTSSSSSTPIKGSHLTSEIKNMKDWKTTKRLGYEENDLMKMSASLNKKQKVDKAIIDLSTNNHDNAIELYLQMKMDSDKEKERIREENLRMERERDERREEREARRSQEMMMFMMAIFKSSAPAPREEDENKK